MSDQKFERFGRYLILDHLVDGGMAKICRARFIGEQANKVVAIKMVQPQFSKDVSFVQMFEDELNVTFGLLHPNIAQMYDYGQVNEQLFTAMEYVDGANLKQYLDRLKEKNFVFPVEISTYIISQVCQALHYAHTFTDKLSGKPSNIIHRDISPHNIMLTYDGAVKVIDFGIAKSDSNSEATQAGTIKGKLSYLAPEYLEGMDLDPRYDLFAVGITLWELLCSRKLFQANNDLAVLKQIQACKVPAPSSINPNVPKELDEIVLKACSKDRNSRFDDMDKFNRALVKFLYSNYPDFNPSDLGYFAKQLFKEEIAEDRKKLVEFGKIDITPFLDEMKREGSASSSSSSQSDVDSQSGQGTEERISRTKKIEIDFGKLDTKNDEGMQIELEADKTATRKTSLRAAGTATGVRRKSTQAGTGVRKGATTTTRSGLKRSSDKTTSTSRKVSQSASKDKQGSGSKAGFILVASLVAVAYFQPDLVKEYTGFDFFGSEPEVSRSVSSETPVQKNNKKVAVPSVALEGKVALVGYESDMAVQINGKLEKVNGIYLSVPLNKSLNIVIIKSGYKPFEKTIRLSASNKSENLVIPDLEKQRVGFLSTTLNFPSGSQLVFNMNGIKIIKDLPFKNERIPAGTYEGVVVNPLLGTEKKVQFEIKENKKHFLE